MKQKRFLALLTGCAMLFGLAGCRGNAEEGAADTEQVTGQTTASTESVKETESKYQKEYDEDGNFYLIHKNTDEIIPTFPEGWSGERISKMVTIDGYQLTLPCKVNDILELSEDFYADDLFDYGDGTFGYEINYKNNFVLYGTCDANSYITFLCTYSMDNDFISFENISASDIEACRNLFDTLSSNAAGSEIIRRFHDENYVYNLAVLSDEKNFKINISWVKI